VFVSILLLLYNDRDNEVIDKNQKSSEDYASEGRYKFVETAAKKKVFTVTRRQGSSGSTTRTFVLEHRNMRGRTFSTRSLQDSK
jgi:hypothetical protein